MPDHDPRAHANRDNFQVEGLVQEALANGVFRVQLSNGHRLLAHASGNFRLDFIKLLPGSKILLEIHPYDLSRGRIIEVIKSCQE
jgi:translation initiation factor IF-1